MDLLLFPRIFIFLFFSSHCFSFLKVNDVCINRMIKTHGWDKKFSILLDQKLICALRFSRAPFCTHSIANCLARAAQRHSIRLLPYSPCPLPRPQNAPGSSWLRATSDAAPNVLHYSDVSVFAHFLRTRHFAHYLCVYLVPLWIISYHFRVSLLFLRASI